MHHHDLKDAFSFAHKFCNTCIGESQQYTVHALRLAQDMMFLVRDTETDDQNLAFRKISLLKIGDDQLRMILRIVETMLHSNTAVRDRVRLELDEKGEGELYLENSHLERMSDQLADFVATLRDYISEKIDG